MVIVLAVFAVLCLVVIVWATPGVLFQRRVDKWWRKGVRETEKACRELSEAIARTGAVFREIETNIQKLQEQFKRVGKVMS